MSAEATQTADGASEDKQNLNVGDRVRVDVGDTVFRGTVTKVDSMGGVRVESPDSWLIRWVTPSNVELLEETTVECDATGCQREAHQTIDGIELDGHQYELDVCEKHFGPNGDTLSE